MYTYWVRNEEKREDQDPSDSQSPDYANETIPLVHTKVYTSEIVLVIYFPLLLSSFLLFLYTTRSFSSSLKVYLLFSRKWREGKKKRTREYVVWGMYTLIFLKRSESIK